MSFTGFGAQALPFFQALAFHQDKAWFDANRHIYERDVRAPLLALIETLSAAFARLELPLRGDAKSIFRLHRDVRFSKDKRPYKTNAGAVLTPDGTKRSPGLLYIHLDPEACFMAAGFWQPEPDQLAAIRRAIVTRAAQFRSVARQLADGGLPFAEGDPTSRLSKGFESVGEDDLATAVKRRNLIVRRPIPPEALASPDLVADLVTFAQRAEPLLRFGWAALARPAPVVSGREAGP